MVPSPANKSALFSTAVTPAFFDWNDPTLPWLILIGGSITVIACFFCWDGIGICLERNKGARPEKTTAYQSFNDEDHKPQNSQNPQDPHV